MTNPSRPFSPAARKRSPLRYRLHRSIGAATGLILLHLIATGLPLQFTDPLNLGGRFVESEELLDWYGIQPPDQAWRSSGVVQIGNRLYLETLPVAETHLFQGAVVQDDLTIIAADTSLLIVPTDTSALSGSSPPETIDLGTGIRRIGLAGERVIVDTDTGLLTMDAALLNAYPVDPPAVSVTWAPLTPLAGEMLTRYQALVRSRILSFERVLQDLHSGRVFGSIGEWVVNLATLAMALLAFTGLLIWWRTQR